VGCWWGAKIFNFVLTLGTIVGLATSSLAFSAASESLVNAVDDVDPSLQVNLAYNTRNNFLERHVSGYSANKCLLKEAAARALSLANQTLLRNNLRLVLRDCWRPRRASLDMVSWAQATDEKNMRRSNMSEHELEIFDDARLFDLSGFLRTTRLLNLGYLLNFSNHNKGSTVDVELEIQNGGSWELLDMGTNFDVFSPKASHGANMGAAVNARRRMLEHVMGAEGFVSIPTEWWHWTHSASNKGPYLDGEVR